MRRWPVSDPRIKLFHYKDILGNEEKVFLEILSHYGESSLNRDMGMLLADLYSAKKQRNQSKHIRNPEPVQWKKHFSPAVKEYFELQYGDILKLYGYE